MGAVLSSLAFLLMGIGGLIAFVKGWMDGLGTVMYAWTGCILVGVLAAMIRARESDFDKAGG